MYQADHDILIQYACLRRTICRNLQIISKLYGVLTIIQRLKRFWSGESAGIAAKQLDSSAEKRSVPSNTSEYWPSIFGYTGLSGATVNTDTILGIPPAFSAIRHISESIASFEWGVFQQQPDGDVIQDYTHDIAIYLSGRVAPNYTYFDFMQALMANALLGGGYALITRDQQTMRPVRLDLIPRELVGIQYDQNGELYYMISGAIGNTSYHINAYQSDVIHIKGITMDGVNGKHVELIHRETFSGGISAQDYMSATFGNKAFIGGIIEYPNQVSATDRKKMEENLTASYSGAKNAGGLMVLDAGNKFVKTQMSPVEAGVIDFTKLNALQVSQIFKIPPHKLAQLDRSTFSNIEQQAFEYVHDCLKPWCVKIQQEFSSKLFYEREKKARKRFFQIDYSSAMMGDMEAQSKFFSSMVSGGIMTPNEARKRLKLNKVKGGDDLFIGQNMAPMNTLSDLLTAKSQAPAKQPAGQNKTDNVNQAAAKQV